MPHFGYYKVDLFDCPTFEMFSNGDDPRAEDILDRGRFEPHSMRLWCHYAKTASAILDIGAHVGVYALAAASLRPDVTVQAFEANPYTAARLRVNKYKNGLANLSDHLVALSDEDTATMVHWAPKQGGNLASGAGLQTELKTGWETAAVITKPLDWYGLQPGPRPLVKIDVEGAEVLVVRGMKTFLTAQPIVILETFHADKAAAITELFPGYRFFKIREAGGLVEQPGIVAASYEDADLNHLLLPPWAALPGAENPL